MSCPHTLKPVWCSVCAGIEPKRITTVGSELFEDGRPTGRSLDHERVITARRTQRRRR